MMYGGIMITLEEDVGGLFSYKNHVSFEFSQGHAFDDPYQLLEGKGQFRGHLKLRSMTDIDEKKINYYLKQMSD